MPTEALYTSEALASIRHDVAIRTPASEIMQHLGWDAAKLDRVCRKHEIELIIPKSTAPKPAPYPPQATRMFSKLGVRQTEIFRILLRHVGRWITADQMAQMITGMGARGIGKSTITLGWNLERMGAEYRIESQMGPGGGYRLVIHEATP